VSAGLPVKAPAAKKKHSRAAHLSALRCWRAVDGRRREWGTNERRRTASPHKGAGSKAMRNEWRCQLH